MENQTNTTSYYPLVTRLRNDSALSGLHSWTVPAVRVKIDSAGIASNSCIATCGIGLRNAGPRVAFAQGRSMPISRGSPPIYDE